MNALRRYPNLLALLGLAAVVILAPLLIKNNYILTVLILVGEFAMVTIGLSLLMGYAGQISLGQATFVGIGAYTMAILSTRFGLSPWLALLAGVLLASGVAWLVGKLIFRLSGHYLAMATLGMNVILVLLLTQEVEWTGGPSGFRGVPNLTLGGLALSSDVQNYYLIWFFTLVVIALSLNIVNSRVGRAMRALHGSEVAAETLGIDTNRFKLQVFALSAAYGALAGGLHAAFLGFISPSSYTIGVSIEVVVMAVVGGLASIWGALFGAATVLAIEQWLRGAIKALIPNASGEHEIIAFGLILILIMIFTPEGLVTAAASAIRARASSLSRGRWSRRPGADGKADEVQPAGG